MEAAFAHLVMWYEERFRCGEMTAVQDKLIHAYKAAYHCLDRVAHDELIRWGKSIHDKFVQDNLHLTARDATRGDVQVLVGAI